MKRLRGRFGIPLIWAALSQPAWVQAPPDADPATGAYVEHSSAAEPDGGSRKGQPAWLKLGAEWRGRVESGATLDRGGRDDVYLNRLRLDATVKPASWVGIFLQGQDARVVNLGLGRGPDDLRNTFDLHQAYVDIGRSEQGWQLRAGRQELSVGDERLVGADSYWDCFGQAFDAVRLAYSGAGFRAAAFAGFRVQPARRRLDPFDAASRISGLTIQFKTRGEGMFESYFLWKRGGDTLDLMGNPGHRDVLTPGVRAQGHLPRRLDYDVEMALQRGHVVGDAIAAWAGHWELGWRPMGTKAGVRLGLEYNFASGDRDPSDKKYGTFDDLYPAGFNKCGMADPIAWRNIRYPAVGVEAAVTGRWTIYGGYRHYWLASVQDGLYPGGDEYLVRNPAAGPDVGAQALGSLGYVRPGHWQFYAGYSRLFPGAFLRQSGYQTALRTAYLLSSFIF